MPQIRAVCVMSFIVILVMNFFLPGYVGPIQIVTELLITVNRIFSAISFERFSKEKEDKIKKNK